MHDNRNFDKVYFENYAKLSLKCIFGDKYKNFICKDRPDLQNLEDSIGIEVVCAITEYEGKYISLANEIYRQDLTIDQKEERMAMRLKTSIDKIPSEFYLKNNASSPSKGLVTPVKYLKNILHANEEKNTKIKNYQGINWKRLGLYIFTFHCFNEQEILSIIPKLCKDSNFNFYIINTIDKLYYIDKTQKLCTYTVTYEDMKYFKRKALENKNKQKSS